MSETLATIETLRHRVYLQLEVTDQEVVASLRAHPDGDKRTAYALAALRVGVLSLRAASGQVDAGAIREAGGELLGKVRDLLTDRAGQLTSSLASSLARYLDPHTGMLEQRLAALVGDGGELERMLKAQVGADHSTLAQTLARHVGDDSALFRVLAPSNADGLLAQLTVAIEDALEQQRFAVLREFSLDSKDSALSRLVTEVKTRHDELHDDLQQQVAAVVREFSLDDDGSALSRLVRRLDASQRAVAAQFSSDNESSVLSRLTRVLNQTSDQIRKNLTLDDPQSALSVLKRELQAAIAELVKCNGEFQAEVRQTLAVRDARKQVEDRSSMHGATFQDRLASLLEAEALLVNDLFEHTGDTAGILPRCKVGDHVITLGTESFAPGERIVWEAKANRAYGVKAALAEMETARKNRQAQVGVFVFEATRAPENLHPFSRFGRDLLVVWDANDFSTDIYIRAALSVAKALVVREQAEESRSTHTASEMDRAIRAIEKQLATLDEVTKLANSIESNAGKIGDRTAKMRRELALQIDSLDEQVAAFRQSSHE